MWIEVPVIGLGKLSSLLKHDLLKIALKRFLEERKIVIADAKLEWICSRAAWELQGQAATADTEGRLWRQECTGALGVHSRHTDHDHELVPLRKLMRQHLYVCETND